MNKMKPKIFIVITVLLGLGYWALAPSLCQGAPRSRRTTDKPSSHSKASVAFEMSMEKDIFAKGEAIQASFSLKNQGKKAVWVNKRFYTNGPDSDKRDREVWVEVISPSGEKLSSDAKYEVSYPRTTEFILLEPGQEITSEKPKNIRNYYKFDDPGAYQIKAFYENTYGAELGLDAFSKLLSTGTKEIHIEP